MSSKVISREAAQELDLRPLYSRGGPHPGIARRDPVMGGTSEDVSGLLEQARREGFEAGRAAGVEEGRKQIAAAAATFQSIAKELAKLPAQVRGECEAATVRLALNIARRILYRELSVDPEALLGLVKAVFQTCDVREKAVLRVATADHESLLAAQQHFALPSNLEVRADASLSRGSVIFETPRGEIDASMETQLLEIERGFADIFEHRK